MITKCKIALLSVALLLLAVSIKAQVSGLFNGSQGNPGSGQFMALNSAKTYLINTYTQKPVFITGDAPQTLAVQVSQADVDTYLADRVSRGFNALWVIMADGGPSCDQTNCPQNYYGNSPFDGADFTNEDAAYWGNVDLVFKKAAALGITVFAQPMFVGDAGSYYHSSINSSSDATITAYGTWLGNRYRNYPNIVWFLGGDCDMTDSTLATRMGDLAAGIVGADPNHLMMMEPIRNQSSQQMWNQATPLTLNMVYPDYSHSQTLCASNYASYHSTIPSFMGEDWYELEHSMTALQLREEAYWEVLSGCSLGRLFGNMAIWTFNGPKNSSGDTWQSQLGSGGSLTEEYQGQLMRSREFWKMAPDSSNAVLTGGIGSGTSISVASCTSDGQTCIVYDPVGNTQAPQINMAYFSGTIHAWWFAPQTGATTDLSTFTNSGTHTFTPTDGNDWVLVLDLNGASLAAPGTTTE